MDQTTPSQVPESKSSKKGLYIVIAIVVLVIIYFIARGGSSGVPQAASVINGVNGVNGVNVQNQPNGATTYSNSEGSVTVGGTSLPANWPSDAPTYANAKIQYSGASNPQTGEQGSYIMFLTSDSAKKVSDFYTAQLTAKGWKVEQTASMNTGSVISATKDTRTMGVYMADSGNGQTTVTVGIGGVK